MLLGIVKDLGSYVLIINLSVHWGSYMGIPARQNLALDLIVIRFTES